MSSKADTKNMNQEKKRKLKPKLRFPEFRDAGEWEEKKLLEVCDVNPSNEELPEFFIYIDLESVVAGKLMYKKKICKKDAPSRAQRLLKNGDVIYQVVRPYQRNNFLFNFDDRNNYVASTGYAQLRSFGVSEFLYQLIHTDTFVNKVIAKCTGSNYPAINSSDLAEINVVIPLYSEQQKIADCLSSISDRITLEAQKLDTLKAHKKGLMQQLFPAEGETLPKLRFPEFRDAGAWKEKQLGDVTNFSSGGTPSKDIPEYWSGSIPWISASSMHNINIEKSDFNITESALKAGSRIAKKGSLLILIRGSMLHRRIPIGIAMIDVAFNQDVKSLLIVKKVDEYFLLYQLMAMESKLLDIVGETGIGAGKIDTDELKRFLIHLPIGAEQQKIADCLSSLDELIAAQTQKIAALKTHKKGLMQQLFPSVEGVK